MKVYICGSHSCGKSTLARYISKKYNLPMITEVARAILSEKELHLDTLRHDIDIVDEYQNEIFYRQISEEKKYENFVSDRSVDCLAYTAQHARIFAKLINSSDLKKYVTNLHKPDSYIFFVRPSKATLKADGVRESINWDGIVAIDAMVKLILEMFEIKYYSISMDSMQERVRLVDAILSK